MRRLVCVVTLALLSFSAHAQIAFDAFGSGLTGTTSLSYTHTPVGTPTSVSICVLHADGQGGSLTVTYGGAATELLDGPYDYANAGGISASLYKIDSPSSGAQTVSITGGTGGRGAYSVTWTGTTELSLNGAVTDIDSASVANPSGTQALGGVSSAVIFCGASGHGTASNVTALTNWAANWRQTTGTETFLGWRYTIVGTTDVTLWATQTTEEFAARAWALRADAPAVGSNVVPILRQRGLR